MDWPNFGWNVAVEFIGLAIGVPVTIYVIDKLIRKREEKRWLGLKALVKEDTMRITNAIITSIRNALDISPYEALQIKSFVGLSAEESDRRTKEFGERIIANFKESYHRKLLEMEPIKWKKMLNDFADLQYNTSKTFSLYAVHLEPELAKHLILVRNNLFSIQFQYAVRLSPFDDPLENISNTPNLMEIRKTAADKIYELIVSTLKLRSSAEKMQ